MRSLIVGTSAAVLLLIGIAGVNANPPKNPMNTNDYNYCPFPHEPGKFFRVAKEDPCPDVGQVIVDGSFGGSNTVYQVAPNSPDNSGGTNPETTAYSFGNGYRNTTGVGGNGGDGGNGGNGGNNSSINQQNGLVNNNFNPQASIGGSGGDGGNGGKGIANSGGGGMKLRP